MEVFSCARYCGLSADMISFSCQDDFPRDLRHGGSYYDLSEQGRYSLGKRDRQ